MYLGVDIGGTKVLLTALDEEGHSAFERQEPTGPSFGPKAAARTIGRAIDDIGSVTCVGVGIPGLVDSAAGLVHSSVILPGWDQEFFAKRIESAVGVPCRIDNDVNNAARGELHARGAPSGSFLLVSVGTGIGGALVLNGTVWTGTAGLAGELGHFYLGHDQECPCGAQGCLGIVAGGATLRSPPTGEPASIDTRDDRSLLRSSELLGIAIADAMNLLNLELVVLTGGVPHSAGEVYRKRAEQSFRANAMPEIGEACRLELAIAGRASGALGAACLARQGTHLSGSPDPVR